MADRTIWSAREESSPAVGFEWVARVERMSSGYPGVILVIEERDLASDERTEMSVQVPDIEGLVAAIVWWKQGGRDFSAWGGAAQDA